MKVKRNKTIKKNDSSDSPLSKSSRNKWKNGGGLGRLRRPFRLAWSSRPPGARPKVIRWSRAFSVGGGAVGCLLPAQLHGDNAVSFDLRANAPVFSEFQSGRSVRSRFSGDMPSLAGLSGNMPLAANDQNGLFRRFRTANPGGFLRISCPKNRHVSDNKKICKLYPS